MKPALVVQAFRGNVCENTHYIDAVLVSYMGHVTHQWLSNPPDQLFFLRSAAKPFQAVPLLRHPLAKQLLTPEHWAVICASHTGSEAHLQLVKDVLEMADCTPADLRCGHHLPFDKAMAQKLTCENAAPEPIHHNCSGKHAGMLLACHLYSWPKVDYYVPEHPLQQMILDVIQALSDTDRIEVAMDGCGAPIAALPLQCAARLFSQLAVLDELAPLRQAMTTYPALVGGLDRIDTLLMQGSNGQLLAKVGADGVIGIANLRSQEGLFLKVLDGSTAIRDRLLVALLAHLDWISAEVAQSLQALPQYSPQRLNTHEQVIGHFEFSFENLHG